MIKKKKYKPTGKRFLKHVQYGFPKLNGVYFVYHKPNRPSAMGSAFPTASYDIDIISEGKSGKRLNILAYIGPLPILTLDEIATEYEDQEINLHVYYVGTLKGALLNKWIHGPFHESIFAQCKDGKPGDYIFEVNQRTTFPKPIMRYSEKHQKFRFVKNESKVIAKMKKLKKQLKDQPYHKKYKRGDFLISTVKGIKILKPYKVKDNIINAIGVVPKKNNSYIFEINERGIFPVMKWKNGWDYLSNELTRKIRTKLGEI